MNRTVWKTLGVVVCLITLYVIFLSPLDRAEQKRKREFNDKCQSYYTEGIRNWECARAGLPTVNTRVCRQVAEGKSTKTVCVDY
jgi:putative component of membrane protein insertase Oxa1/YidC/SpoIIIJ protein YidD